MTAGELHDLLAEDGAQLLSQTLEALQTGSLTAVAQNDEKSCYAPMLDKSLCPLDWDQPARQLHNRIRGLNPWPVATCRVAGTVLKVFQSRVSGPAEKAAGTILGTDPLTVACGDGLALELLQIQAQGAKRMASEEYFRGHPLPAGVREMDR